MGYAIANFHEAMRAVLGEEGDESIGYEYSENQLSAALRTAVRLGIPNGQSGIAIATADPDELTIEPANPDTWAWLMLRGVFIICGGATAIDVRTRAMSVKTDVRAYRERLETVEYMIGEIDARGNVGGTSLDTGHKGLFASVQDVVTACALPSFGGNVIRPIGAVWDYVDPMTTIQ